MPGVNTLVGQDAITVRSGTRRRSAFRPAGLGRHSVALGLLACAALGALFTLQGGGNGSGTTPTIEGTWELAALNGKPTGPEAGTEVVRQRVWFRAGKVRGETLVQPRPEAGRLALPFPDESVDRVVPSSDDAVVRVLWSGTYKVDEHRQATLRIGKAVYFARLTLRASGESMDFNQDVILTLPGVASYRRSVSPPDRPPTRELEPAQGVKR